MAKLPLRTLVEGLFDLNVEAELDIGESFSSDVLRFKCNGRAWVIKRPFSRKKAQRESGWLR